MPNSTPPHDDEIHAALRLAAIVESSHDAIISKNLSGVVQSWNRAAERIFGYTAEEAVGQSILLIIPKELHHEEAEILEKLRQGRRIDNYETTRRRKDGKLIDISLTVSPIRDGHGRVIGASKIARDITDHKAAQLALVETQRRLSVTLQSIGDAVVATDSDGRITFVNRVAEELLRCEERQIIGRPLGDIFRLLNEDTRHSMPNPVQQVLKLRKPVDLANYSVLVRPDGSELPIDDSAAPIFDTAGAVLGVVMVFRDVTEHRKALRTSAWLSAIVASSDDAIVSKDLNGTITTWNRGAERIFGYAADEIIGLPITTIIPPERHAEERDILARLGRGERIEHYETVRRKKDGTLCDMSLTVSPIQDEYGRVVGASKIGRDITAQKRAQQLIIQAQQRWKVTLGSIGDAVIATDSEARVTFANPVALRLLERTSEDVLGRPLSEVFHIVNEETRSLAENPVERVIREGIVVGLANHTVLVRREGGDVPIDDSAAPIRDADGNLFGVVLVFRDITERKQVENELLRWRTELETRVAERTEQLVRSQERLRGLASQLNVAEQRERRRLAANLHDYLAQLLALARIKIGQMRQNLVGTATEPGPVLSSIDDILQDCLRYTRTLIAQLSPSVLQDLGLVPAIKWLAEQMEHQGLRVEVRVLTPAVPRINDAKADLLFQAVRELLLNVLKHAGVSEATVSFGKLEGGEWVIAVEDHGMGFDSGTMQHRSTDEHFGLFSIQERMEAMSGWCRIHSTPGRGTRVELGVPVTDEQNNKVLGKGTTIMPGVDHLQRKQKAGSQWRVVLIDDHAMVRQGLRSILETYADLDIVAEGRDGEEAVSLAHAHQPDVVLMDINLPGLNGIEATRRIKRAWPDTVIIGLSVQSSPQTVEALMNAGGAALLSKEQATEELYRTIKGFVDASQDTPRGTV